MGDRSTRVLSSGVKVHEFRPRRAVPAARSSSELPPPPFSNQVQLPSLLNNPARQVVPTEPQLGQPVLPTPTGSIPTGSIPAGSSAIGVSQEPQGTRPTLQVPAFQSNGAENSDTLDKSVIGAIEPKTIEFHSAPNHPAPPAEPSYRPLPSFGSATGGAAQGSSSAETTSPDISSLPSFRRRKVKRDTPSLPIEASAPLTPEPEPAATDVKPQPELVAPPDSSLPEGSGKGADQEQVESADAEANDPLAGDVGESESSRQWSGDAAQATPAIVDEPYALEASRGFMAPAPSFDAPMVEGADFSINDDRAAWRYAWQPPEAGDSADSADSADSEQAPPLHYEELSADITLSGAAPTATADAMIFRDEVLWGDDPRYFTGFDYHWTAPGTYHQPLYFEDVNLERAGHSWGVMQPAVSAAHFFSRIPALPYLLVAHPGAECVYTLGHYRPGSCAPHLRRWPRIKSLAALAQGATATGLVFLVP